jgi:hypothetical protein
MFLRQCHDLVPVSFFFSPIHHSRDMGVEGKNENKNLLEEKKLKNKKITVLC